MLHVIEDYGPLVVGHVIMYHMQLAHNRYKHVPDYGPLVVVAFFRNSGYICFTLNVFCQPNPYLSLNFLNLKREPNKKEKLNKFIAKFKVPEFKFSSISFYCIHLKLSCSNMQIHRYKNIKMNFLIAYEIIQNLSKLSDMLSKNLSKSDVLSKKYYQSSIHWMLYNS